MKKILVLNACGKEDPIYRMKILPFIKYKNGEYAFIDPSNDHSKYDGIILRLQLDSPAPERVLSILKENDCKAPTVLLLPDFESKHLKLLLEIAPLIDEILVPTPEMLHLVSAFIDTSASLLFDPVDFGLEHFVQRSTFPDYLDKPLKVVWFGYPESFNKSMSWHLPAIKSLVESNEIEFHVITRNSSYGKKSFFTIHQYDQKSFLTLLDGFDICLLSHTPNDFSVSTYSKSENKAVLSINQGLPIVATRTPAYKRLMTACHTSEYLFSSNSELVSAIRLLKIGNNRNCFLKLSQEKIFKNYSSKKMSDDFDLIFKRLLEDH